jgi:hypothetical protein
MDCRERSACKVSVGKHEGMRSLCADGRIILK